MKRIFLIVLDSFGIGAMLDAAEYGDAGTNTLKSVSGSPYFKVPNLNKLGLSVIDGVSLKEIKSNHTAVVARLKEASKGKDTTIGHWEIAGLCSKSPLPTYKEGFPKEILDEFSRMTGRGILCNKPYSGTEVIKEYGDRHVETGDLIVYTSADSVFQIAAHEDIVPVDTLYEYCRMARQLLQGRHGVGRVIARPFTGKSGEYKRTSKRHDYSLLPPGNTMLDELKDNGYDVIGIGKINDIFAGRGITEYKTTQSNEDGIQKTLEYLDKDFEGLCFVNLVDFDMLYGHRNDIDGYARAISYFDDCLPQIMDMMREDDLLMITADHGCDPGYCASTDHSREHVPFLMFGAHIKPANLGTRETFSDIAATVLDYFGLPAQFGTGSMLSRDTEEAARG